MRGTREHVTGMARELIRCEIELRAAEEAHWAAEEARRMAAASLEQARDALSAAIDRGESLLCDGHLITRRADDDLDVIAVTRVVRLN